MNNVLFTNSMIGLGMFFVLSLAVALVVQVVQRMRKGSPARRLGEAESYPVYASFISEHSPNAVMALYLADDSCTKPDVEGYSSEVSQSVPLTGVVSRKLVLAAV